VVTPWRILLSALGLTRKEVSVWVCLAAPEVPHSDYLVPLDPYTSLEPRIAGTVYYTAILDHNVVRIHFDSHPFVLMSNKSL
jgi:hypothetical protein